MFGFRRRRPLDELPLSRQKPLDEDVRAELAQHLELRAGELIAQGWTPDAARAEARRLFGDLQGVETECREITARTRRAWRRAEALASLRQDLVFALRMLRKSPAFTLAAVLTLSLGIGANTAIFSVVNAVLLRPLPYDRPEQLVDIAEAHEQGWSNPPYANAEDWRAQARSLDGLASYMSSFRTILGTDQPLRLRETRVSRDFFRIFRVQPVRGRLPTPQEHLPGAVPTAVVSWRFWNEHFHGETDLSRLRIRSFDEYQVIGVLPPGFHYPNDTDVWEPLELLGPTPSRTAHNFSVIARLRPGVTPRAAQQELTALTLRMRQQYLPDFDGVGALVQPLQQQLTGSLQRPLYLLLGASGLVLLLACTNLASTMLARGTARASELAMRTALGAGRLRLVRQLFTESLLLAGLGCLAGFGLALGLLRVFARLAPPRLALTQVTLDGWVLGFAVAVTVATAVMMGLFPALRASDTDPGVALREGGRGSAGGSRQRVWGVLVGLEVALAVVLLCGGGLLIRSFARVLAVDPGFNPDSVLTITVTPPISVYATDQRLDDLYTRLLERLGRLPGVRAAGLVTALPLTRSGTSGSFGIEGVPTPPQGYGPGSAGYSMVGGEYFRAMGIPIVAGRAFDERDAAGGAPVVMVNQALVERWFPDVDPVGRRIRLTSGMDRGGDGWLTIVGVAANVRRRDLTTPPAPETFVPLHQRPTRGWLGVLVLRTAVDPRTLIGPARAAIRDVADDLVPEFATMNEQLASSEADRRFTMLILSAFALVALLLSAIGVYGVVSYAVAQRTREIGIRIALGARPAAVRGLVQRRAMVTILIGLGLGLATALVGARVMGGLLYEVEPADPLTFAGGGLLLALVGWIASWIPAFRGSRVDPLTAIRVE